MKKRRVITASREIYDKFHKLHFTSEVTLKGIKDAHIDKILNNVNKDILVLEKQRIGDDVIIKKKRALNFSVYLR